MPVSVLLIDARSERTEILVRALAVSGFEVVGIVSEFGDVHGTVARLKPDAILIDSESPTRDTLEGLAAIGKRFPRPIVMLSNRDGDFELARTAAALGISAYVVDGVSPPLVRSLIETTIALFQQRTTLTIELAQTQRTMTERRDIDRAKCMLMEHYGLSERDAYAKLRKMAMDRSLRIADLSSQLVEHARA